MADTGSIFTEGGEFFISEPKITEALKVIRPIPKLRTDKTTTVRFSVKHDGCCAPVRIDITPFRLTGTANCGFRAFWHATPCQRFEDSALYDQIQKVYDAIVPVQWTFDSDCTEIVRKRPDACSCRHKIPFDSNSTLEVSSRDLYSRPPASTALPGKRSQHDTSTTSGNVVSSELPSGLGPTKHWKRRKQERKPLENMVEDLVSKIQKGQERLKKRAVAKDLSGVQAIVLRHGEEDTGQVLDKLSKEFHKESKAKGTKSDSWDCWYFEGCMAFVNHVYGDLGRSTSAAKAICVINSIVDRLLVTDGAVATVIFGALAETGSRLSDISREHAVNRDTIIKLAAHELQGKLQTPPEWYEMPNAPVWVALVKSRPRDGSYSFQDACRDLAFPQLAALDLKPQWTGNSSTKQLLMKVEFALVRASWVEAQQVRHAAPAQQTLQIRGPESQPGTESPVAGPVMIDRAGSSVGDTVWGEWANLDLSAVAANMDDIDFGCDPVFGLGSLDGVIDE